MIKGQSQTNYDSRRSQQTSIDLRRRDRSRIRSDLIGIWREDKRNLLVVASEAFTDDLAFESSTFLKSEPFVVLSQTSLALLVNHQYEPYSHLQASKLSQCVFSPNSDLWVFSYFFFLEIATSSLLCSIIFSHKFIRKLKCMFWPI